MVGYAAGEAAAVLVESHRDSLRNAGSYDGILRIKFAYLALEKLRKEDFTIDCRAKVLAFADEEVVRIFTVLLGPRVLAGTVRPEVLNVAEADNTRRKDTLNKSGGEAKSIFEPELNLNDERYYLDVHWTTAGSLGER